MPRICTVCAHPKKREIDECLVSGQSNRSIAKRFGVDDAAVFRHRNAHLLAALVQAKGAQQAASADVLLDQVRALHSRTMTVLDQAEAAGNVRVMLPAIREARANLELLARLLAELNDRAQVTVGVALVQSPEWVSLQARIVQALGPHPEARQAVLAAVAEASR